MFQPISANAGGNRSSKRRRVTVAESDDEFDLDDATQEAMLDGMSSLHPGSTDGPDADDFIAPDESEEEVAAPRKRKRQQSSQKNAPSSPPALPDDAEMTGTSTAQQWTYDPENLDRLHPPPAVAPKKAADKAKTKVHTIDPEMRYPWLAQIQDAERHSPDHPDYDPRTLYIPPMAWDKFSAFEKQYWEIKCKFWDSVVFFKKGKFYELYENDATIGHQLFDLKLTDRVNMRMVGVPEASLDMWASQFVAKGFKVARVDQMESALAKEMRERGGQKPNKAKADKVIRRELASVLTAGTLVDAGMLQDDMSTYCMAIKEIDVDDQPAFGIAFVDTATAQFQFCEFC